MAPSQPDSRRPDSFAKAMARDAFGQHDPAPLREARDALASEIRGLRADMKELRAELRRWARVTR